MLAGLDSDTNARVAIVAALGPAVAPELAVDAMTGTSVFGQVSMYSRIQTALKWMLATIAVLNNSCSEMVRIVSTKLVKLMPFLPLWGSYLPNIELLQKNPELEKR